VTASGRRRSVAGARVIADIPKNETAMSLASPQKRLVSDDHGSTITAKGSLLFPLFLANTCVLMFASRSVLSGTLTHYLTALWP
jgi:hypothetical protein